MKQYEYISVIDAAAKTCARIRSRASFVVLYHDQSRYAEIAVLPGFFKHVLVPNFISELGSDPLD